MRDMQFRLHSNPIELVKLHRSPTDPAFQFLNSSLGTPQCCLLLQPVGALCVTYLPTAFI